MCDTYKGFCNVTDLTLVLMAINCCAVPLDTGWSSKSWWAALRSARSRVEVREINDNMFDSVCRPTDTRFAPGDSLALVRRGPQFYNTRTLWLPLPVPTKSRVP